MLAMLAIIFLAAWTKKVKIYSAAFLVLLAFIDFNSVLFRQYMTWVFPVIPLALCEIPYQKFSAARLESEAEL